MRLWAILLLAAALPAQAQAQAESQAQEPRPARQPGGGAQIPLDADAFDSLTRGRIMAHFMGGSRYGAEEYLPDRRVIWADENACMHGTWAPRGSLICFDYKDGQPERCWHYFRDGEGLSARYNGDPAEPLIALRAQSEPLLCPGEQPNA